MQTNCRAVCSQDGCHCSGLSGVLGATVGRLLLLACACQSDIGCAVTSVPNGSRRPGAQAIYIAAAAVGDVHMCWRMRDWLLAKHHLQTQGTCRATGPELKTQGTSELLAKLSKRISSTCKNGFRDIDCSDFNLSQCNARWGEPALAGWVGNANLTLIGQSLLQK
jgi:hypothetical protein